MFNFFLGALFPENRGIETLEQVRRHLLYMQADPVTSEQDYRKAIQYGLDMIDEVIRLRKEIERLETALDAAIARAGDDN